MAQFGRPIWPKLSCADLVWPNLGFGQTWDFGQTWVLAKLGFWPNLVLAKVGHCHCRRANSEVLWPAVGVVRVSLVNVASRRPATLTREMWFNPTAGVKI